MTGNIRTNRPARAAIAAVLALTATPLLAQTAAPTAMPSSAPTIAPEVAVPTVAPSAPAPAQTAPDSVEFTPSQPVVQATPPIEERIAAATAAAEAEKATAQATAPRAETRRAAPVRTAQAAPAPRAMAAAPATTAPAPVAPVAAPDPAPMTPQTQDTPAAATPAPSPLASASSRTDQALLWALGGGALLLLGLGGTALMRRRRSDEEVAPVAYESEPTLVPAAPTPMMAAVEPVAAEPVATRPAMAPASQRIGEDATLEAMVAAAPSAENPFRTRAKRMRRAQYLLSQDQATPAATPAPQTMHAEPALAPAADRSQTVYRFGNQPARPGFLKPRTR